MPLFKKKVVSWVHDPNKLGDIVWRIPNDAYPKVKDVNGIIVKEFERAVFFKGGTLQSVLPSGKHLIPKDVDEVVWVDTSPKPHPYGIPNYRGPITMDNFQIGFSGTITLRVNGDREEDVAKFLTRITAGRQCFTCEQLVDWLREGPLTSVFRDTVNKFTHEQFMRLEREEIISHVKAKLVTELSRYGLELISIDITGVTAPKKVEWK